MECPNSNDLAQTIYDHMRSELFDEKDSYYLENYSTYSEESRSPRGSFFRGNTLRLNDSMRADLLGESPFDEYISYAKKVMACTAGLVAVLAPTVIYLSSAVSTIASDVIENGTHPVTVGSLAIFSTLAAAGAVAVVGAAKIGLWNFVNYRLWKRKKQAMAEPDLSDIDKLGYRPYIKPLKSKK
jgi:hypothetical protein